jgi:hypothetical protein
MGLPAEQKAESSLPPAATAYVTKMVLFQHFPFTEESQFLAAGVH